MSVAVDSTKQVRAIIQASPDAFALESYAVQFPQDLFLDMNTAKKYVEESEYCTKHNIVKCSECNVE